MRCANPTNSQSRRNDQMSTIQYCKVPKAVRTVSYLHAQTINGKNHLVKYSIGKIRRTFWHDRVAAKVVMELLQEISDETMQAIWEVNMTPLKKAIVVDPLADKVNRRTLVPGMENWSSNFFARHNQYLTMINAAMLTHYIKEIPDYNKQVMAIVNNELNEKKKQDMVYAIAMLSDDEWMALGAKRLAIMQETTEKIAELTKMGYTVTK